MWSDSELTSEIARGNPTVNVARSNIDLADKTLTQSRDRFSAGVTDTVEVVQSQEAVAGESLQL